MVASLRHGSSTSQGPRSYNEDLTLTISDLSERISQAKAKTNEDLESMPSPSAYYGVSHFPLLSSPPPSLRFSSSSLDEMFLANVLSFFLSFFFLILFFSSVFGFSF